MSGNSFDIGSDTREGGGPAEAELADAVLARYGEIALKGKNRPYFEDRLADNIRDKTRARVRKTSGRFIIHPQTTNPRIIRPRTGSNGPYHKDSGECSHKHASNDPHQEMEGIIRNLKKVFGITSISPAREVRLDIDDIKEEALKQAKNLKNRDSKSFRITVQRIQKRLKPSPELEREIGAYVAENTGKKVKLEGPDLEISVEIGEKAYVFTERIQCLGGLPVGVEGSTALICEKGREEACALAGLLMMKRGCNVYPFLLSGKKGKGMQEHEQHTGLLHDHGARKPETAGDIKEAEHKAAKKRCRALVIASTLDDIYCPETDLMILWPLIRYTKKDIRRELEGFKNAGQSKYE
ncbi:MAG: THUMP domain-containing protein [Candidatus Woesearchaeota archaeon]